MSKKQDKLIQWANELPKDKEIIEINVLEIPAIIDGKSGKLQESYNYNHGYYFSHESAFNIAYTNAGFEFLYYDETSKKLWLKNRNYNKELTKSSVDICPINKLLDKQFFIPLYQRGYKWDKQQAVDLLDDINEFISKTNKSNSEDSNEIYCIQPLVVKKDDTKWDVVDGQQRLTTIFLLLTYLNNVKKYTIEYQKESQSNNEDSECINRESYLKDPTDDKKMESIDFYHINLVYHTIQDWFNDKNKDYKDNFLKLLLNHICFIWYEIGENEDPIHVFTRLNIGKIPLTDSELIKALFLNQNNFDTIEKGNLERQQKEIAIQWDQIEYTLQNDEFWCFLHNDKCENYKQPTRIDLIFNLIMKCDVLKVINDDSTIQQKLGNDNHKTFRYFYEGFKKHFDVFLNGNNQQDWLLIVWREVEKYYCIFKEWFNDYRIYHYIGYLTMCKNDSKFNYTLKGNTYSNTLESIVLLWNNSINKDDFIDSLKQLIKNGLANLKFFKNSKLDNWIFEDKIRNDGEKNESCTPKAKCRPVLLLHNIETILNRSEGQVKKYSLPEFNRFPFHLFQKEAWEVEHIRSNAGDDVKDRNKQELFLYFTKDYLTKHNDKYAGIILDIEKFINKDADAKTFEVICGELNTIDNTTVSALGDREKNKIWNYTLLDSATNEEYHNNIFPIKRMYIINKENGIKSEPILSKDESTGKFQMTKKSDAIAFIPPCTKNIFTKAYSIEDSNISAWTPNNAQDYLNDMKEKLKFYLGD